MQNYLMWKKELGPWTIKLFSVWYESAKLYTKWDHYWYLSSQVNFTGISLEVLNIQAVLSHHFPRFPIVLIISNKNTQTSQSCTLKFIKGKQSKFFFFYWHLISLYSREIHSNKKSSFCFFLKKDVYWENLIFFSSLEVTENTIILLSHPSSGHF